MNIQSRLSVTLLCAASVVALSSAAQAQDAATETVVVTGSRVIADAANSPTPLTVVTTAQLLATTPTNLPDALNKLPVFQNSTSPTTSNNAQGNAAANTLNLRNFGTQRTLVLLDGHRAPPSTSAGTVDIDTLPQGLVSRVDVVTGGASAVYGSDAVTGVVNFILDKHFTGLKLNANAGISTYGDGMSYQVAGVGGTDLFGGRAHLEGSVKYYHVDQIAVNARPYGQNTWVSTGAGTAASPYVTTPNGRLNSFSFGGKITCTGTVANPCTANNTQFATNGVIGPFDPGIVTGTPSVGQGGDGTYPTHVAEAAALTTKEAFARFSYNLDDTTNAYVQASVAQAYDLNNWTNAYIQTGTTTPNTFFKNNPFLTPVAQAALAGGTTSTFTLTKYERDRYFITRSTNTNISMTAGVDGNLMGKYDWSVFYTHGYSRLKDDDPTNMVSQKMYAAEDAVTGAGGQIVCYVSTTAYASLYPGCVPMNPFGPTAMTNSQYNYITQDTGFIEQDTLDNVGGSIAGSLFDLPAGPVKAALSGEMRWHTYEVDAMNPTGFVNCLGLRNCTTGTSLYLGSSIAALAPVSDNVWEFAGEVNVPLLKDLPFLQSLSTDLAGRYTDYSISGAVQTWKVGLDYHVNDDVRFRATTSIDIRAPTLNDFYAPQNLGHGGFTDLHTGNIVQNPLAVTQGNPNLVPEVARTYTAGVVLTPTFLPDFTASLDYYRIGMKNSISSISGNTTGVQQACEQSNGTSPFCVLIVRPLPFADRTLNNYPTAILSESLNAATLKTEGWELELDYGFQMADVWSDAPGALNLRFLANYQPYNTSQSYVAAPVLPSSQSSKTLATAFAAYSLGNWTFNLQDRWDSGWSRSTSPGLVFYAQPHGPSENFVDLNIDKKFTVDDNTLDGYFSVQNLFNKTPPIAPVIISVPGLYAAGYKESGSNAIKGVDVIGRYFTIGVRANL